MGVHKGHSRGCQILIAEVAGGVGMGRRVRVAGQEQHGVGAGHLPNQQAWDLIGTPDCQGECPRCATARRGKGWRDVWLTVLSGHDRFAVQYIFHFTF